MQEHIKLRTSTCTIAGFRGDKHSSSRRDSIVETNGTIPIPRSLPAGSGLSGHRKKACEKGLANPVAGQVGVDGCCVRRR